MKTIAEYLGLRRGPDSVPFGSLPFRLKLTFVLVACAASYGVSVLVNR